MLQGVSTPLFSISIGEVMNRNRVRHQDVYRFDSIKAVSANPSDASKVLQVIGANLRRNPPVRFFPRRAFEINDIAKLIYPHSVPGSELCRLTAADVDFFAEVTQS